MDKQFNGVITNWRLEYNRIVGMEIASSSNGLESGSIRTSDVVQIFIKDGHRFVETRNSYYMLLD